MVMHALPRKSESGSWATLLQCKKTCWRAAHWNALLEASATPNPSDAWGSSHGFQRAADAVTHPPHARNILAIHARSVPRHPDPHQACDSLLEDPVVADGIQVSASSGGPDTLALPERVDQGHRIAQFCPTMSGLLAMTVMDKVFMPHHGRSNDRVRE
jgi:hypothetical protein